MEYRCLVDDFKGPPDRFLFGVRYCNRLGVYVVGSLGEETALEDLPVAGVVYYSNRGLNTRYVVKSV